MVLHLDHISKGALFIRCRFVPFTVQKYVLMDKRNSPAPGGPEQGSVLGIIASKGIYLFTHAQAADLCVVNTYYEDDIC